MLRLCPLKKDNLASPCEDVAVLGAGVLYSLGAVPGRVL